jgi:hypothetical protein
MEKKRPTFGHGKICYVEIPAVNIDESAAFYQDLFGWTIRKRGDGSVSFDDSVMQVSGSWVLNRKPYTETGMVVSIMVDDAAATLERIVAKGRKGDSAHRNGLACCHRPFQRPGRQYLGNLSAWGIGGNSVISGPSSFASGRSGSFHPNRHHSGGH